MAVPQSTAVLPPAFSAMLPPMVEAQALVGSVANTRPLRSAYCMASWVITPASRRSTGIWRTWPSSPVNSRVSMPWMRLSFSVLIITQSARTGTAPPVSPVPPPRGMAKRPSSSMAASRPATCSPPVGRATATGRWRRQSVASVAWLIRAKGSKWTLAAPISAPSRLRMARRRAAAPPIWRCSSRMRSRHSRTRLSTLSLRSGTTRPRWAVAAMMSRSLPMVRKKLYRRRGESISSW